MQCLALGSNTGTEEAARSNRRHWPQHAPCVRGRRRADRPVPPAVSTKDLIDGDPPDDPRAALFERVQLSPGQRDPRGPGPRGWPARSARSAAGSCRRAGSLRPVADPRRAAGLPSGSERGIREPSMCLPAEQLENLARALYDADRAGRSRSCGARRRRRLPRRRSTRRRLLPTEETWGTTWSSSETHPRRSAFICGHMAFRDLCRIDSKASYD